MFRNLRFRGRDVDDVMRGAPIDAMRYDVETRATFAVILLKTSKVRVSIFSLRPPIAPNNRDAPACNI